MSTIASRWVAALALVGALASPARPLRAQAPASDVFAQAQYGTRFDDAVYGLDTRDHHMSTLLLNADAGWSHGETGFFVRAFTGDFVDGTGALTGDRTLVYAEWTTRLALWRNRNADSCAACVRQLFVATQLVRASGSRADLLAAGAKLRLGALATTNTLYWRHSLGDRPSAKWRTSWYLPFHVAALPLWSDGSLDVVSPTSAGTDLCFMPSVLLDASRLLGARSGSVGVGSEWFLHRARGARLSSPQLIVRWSL